MKSVIGPRVAVVPVKRLGPRMQGAIFVPDAVPEMHLGRVILTSRDTPSPVEAGEIIVFSQGLVNGPNLVFVKHEDIMGTQAPEDVPALMEDDAPTSTVVLAS